VTEVARTRPKDRRATILSAAGARFHRQGYAGTSLEDIASDLGITAPAIYRHFRGKGDLYTATLEVVLTRLEASVAAASSAADLVRGLAEVGVAHPTLGLLWGDDRRRQLVDPDGSLERRLDATADAIAALLAQRRQPELTPLLARCVLAAVSSTGFYESSLDRQAQTDELERSVAAIAGFAPQQPLVAVAATTDAPPSRPWATRRTALIDACAALAIRPGGLQAVTVEEIASVAGVAPTTLYQLFGGKADLLAAVLRRAVNWAMTVLQQASSQAGSAEEALTLAVGSSLELTTQHPTWAGSLADQMSDLPLEQLTGIVAIVDDYLAEWLALCCAVATDLPAEAVRIRMRAALAVINDRAAAAVDGPVLAADDLAGLVHAMLTRSESTFSELNT
jgi:AcrR family transcriptional regulator